MLLRVETIPTDSWYSAHVFFRGMDVFMNDEMNEIRDISAFASARVNSHNLVSCVS